MRLKLQKRIRNIIIGILITASILSVVMVFITINAKEEVITDTILYTYNLQPKVNYYVNIVDNILYPEAVQEEGLTYINKLIDNIHIDLGMLFKGSEQYPTKIEYKVDAIVSASQQSSIEGVKGLSWSKTFPLSDSKNININSEIWDKTLSFDIDMTEYENFSIQANDITGVNLTSNLSIVMSGNITVETSYKALTIPFSSGIQFPLNQSMFTIARIGTESVSDNLKETHTQIVPKTYDKKIIVLFILAAFVFILGIVYLFIFTIEPSDEDFIARKVNKILKNYNSRIILLSSYNEKLFKQIFYVNSIDDLIKVADEIEKPIYYYDTINDTTKSNMFYLQDVDNIYIYAVEVSKNKSDINKITEEGQGI